MNILMILILAAPLKVLATDRTLLGNPLSNKLLDRPKNMQKT
jgi:hypothetical protein